MKRKLSLLLAGLMCLPSLPKQIYADNSKSSGVIESTINFTQNETKDYIINKNLKVTLKEDGNIIREINLKDVLNNKNYEDTLASFKSENDLITTIDLKFKNIKPSKSYMLSISGDKYTTVDIPMQINEHSKKVNLNTSNTFLYGDLNNDNKINVSDRKLLEDSIINKNNTLDLNNDSIIDIEDIAYINRKMDRSSKTIVYDTTPLKEVISNNIVKSIPSDANFTIENGNDLTSLFTEGEELRLKSKNNDKNVEVPIIFNKPQEMSTFYFKVGAETKPEDVNVIIKNESGEVVKSDIASASVFSNMRSSEKVISINIGNRVPVKEIIIEVKPNDTGYTVIKDVNYIKDVVDESVVEDTSIKNLKVIAGDEKVDLSWKTVPNVRGYRVYYGKNKENLDLTIDTVETKLSIEGLENDTTYYFMVKAVSGIWEGDASNIISATPKTPSIPEKPDYLKATAEDSLVNLSWKTTEGAETYNVYMQKGLDGEIIKVASNIKSTSYTVNNLSNGVIYRFYVTAVNKKGESKKSEPADAKPVKEEIVIPTLPTLDRIPREDIISVTMGYDDNVSPDLYPNNSFKPDHLIDGDFNTHWVARKWFETNTFSFTFNEPKDMDYLIWVPRLDGKYRKSFDRYDISVWLENDDLDKPGRQIAKDRPISFRYEDDRYFVFDFPKQEKVKKILVHPIQWNGSPTNMNASEVAFYNYNDIGDQVDNLFTDGSRTEIKQEVTLLKIEELRKRVNVADGYVHSKDILNKELDIAESLLKNNTDALGYIKNNFISIKPEEDNKNYQISISQLQPLGISAMANTKLEIFAHIPEGETVQLVATQYFEQSNSWKASPITLKEGRNIISIPKIGNEYWDRGGSLYVTYSGDNPSQVKLQIFKGNKIPYLELNDIKNIDETIAKERIKTFIKDLEEYVPTLTGNLNSQALNVSEISLPNILLSLPASQILKGINENVTTLDDKINKVYDTILAWDDLIKIAYKTYGIDDHKNSLTTRHNIRYMKMFAGAFMYAANDHIGIGYDSVPGLMNGKPLSKTTDQNSNKLFGWGISHEIGHVMDKLGHAEITNNIYSLMIQAADGKNDSNITRLESSNVYPKAFQKVAVGNKGASNDVFTQLAMYWQLKLAYGDNFYGDVYKLIRSGKIEGKNIDEKFMLASSQVANKDLTEFFTRWGMDISEELANKLKSNKVKEDRAIWYLSDSSKRSNFIGNQNINVNVNIEKSTDENNDNVVNINITPTNEASENIQGYEIARNNKIIGFTTTGNFVDKIDAGNFASTYTITPIDIKGNISSKYTSQEMKFVFDNVVKDNVSIEKINETYSKVTFSENQIVSGIKLTPKDSNSLDTNGQFKVYIKDMNQEPTKTQIEDDKNISIIDNTYISKDTEESKQTNILQDEQNNNQDINNEDVDNEDITQTINFDNEQNKINNKQIENTKSIEESKQTNILQDEQNNNQDINNEDINNKDVDNEDITQTINFDNEQNKINNKQIENTKSIDQNNNINNLFTLAKNGDFSKNASDDKSASFISYFNKPNATQGELDKIWQYETKEIILEGIDLNKYNVEIISYTGDNIEFLDTAFGILKEDSFGIPANTKVIIGKYRGNTSTNEIIVNGRFLVNNPIDSEPSYEERPINGKIIMLDEIPENGKITSSTEEGIFIFIPNLEAEEALSHSHQNVSKLPVQIKAEMSKNSSNGSRITSDTIWIDTPSFDTLPKITFN